MHQASLLDTFNEGWGGGGVTISSWFCALFFLGGGCIFRVYCHRQMIFLLALTLTQYVFKACVRFSVSSIRRMPSSISIESSDAHLRWPILWGMLSITRKGKLRHDRWVFACFPLYMFRSFMHLSFIIILMDFISCNVNRFLFFCFDICRQTWCFLLNFQKAVYMFVKPLKLRSSLCSRIAFFFNFARISTA